MPRMPYIAASDRYDVDDLQPLRPLSGSSSPRSRSGCGTTSATTSRSRRSARSCAAPSTAASPTSTSPTTTARRPARPRRTSAASCARTSAPYRDELIISTKAGYDMWPGPYGEWGSRKYLLASLDQCAAAHGARLRRHLLLAPLRPRHPARGDARRASATAVKQGKALYAGISSYSGARTAEAVQILRDLGTPLLIHQPSYSLLNRWIEEDLLDVLEEEGVGLIVFSPLGQGLLTDRYLDGVPEDSRAAKGVFLDRATSREREPRARARPQRDRQGPRADARADGDRVGAARRARDDRR